MNANNIRETVRTGILSLAGITSQCSTRVYPAELALVYSPTYPCITISTPPGGIPGAYIEYNIQRMLIHVWAKGGYDLGHTLMDIVSPGLHRQKFTSGGVACVPEQIGSDAELYDDITQVHGVFTTWNVRSLS